MYAKLQRLVEIYPRSISSATGVKVELSRVYKCFVFLLPIYITLHLLVLKEICHCAYHWNRLSKSCCNLTCSWCLKPVKCLVSSAKSLTIDSTILGRTLINIRNKAGPKTLPWGTPLVTFVHADALFPSTTFCCLASRNLPIHFITDLLIF